MKNKDGTVLEPDQETAPIVQKIFAMALDGKSAKAIATSLTENGDITPLKYRVLYRDNFGERGAAKAVDKWNYTTVKRILKNPVYLGHTILGKTKRQVSNRKRNLPFRKKIGSSQKTRTHRLLPKSSLTKPPTLWE